MPLFSAIPRHSAAVLVGLLSTSVLHYASADPAPPPWVAQPGWTETRGGEGGKVIRVTSLEARGKGSLAEALAEKGARVIEFAIAGTIDLGGRSLSLKEPRVTIAGETAPAPGITLVNGG